MKTDKKISVDIEKYLPFLNHSEERLIRAFKNEAIIKRYNRNEVLCWEGDQCRYFYVVISGSIRVFKGADSGREITLYKVRDTNSCILTVFALLNRSEFRATAIAERDTTVIAVPRSLFSEWFNEYQSWRNYTLDLLSRDLGHILGKIESLAFQRLDERIAGFLLQTARKDHPAIEITHSDIARELGTVREVVSRILKSFEKQKLVSLSRGTITILNNRALFRFAG